MQTPNSPSRLRARISSGCYCQRPSQRACLDERLEWIRKGLPLFAQNRRDTYPLVSVSNYSASTTSVSQSPSGTLAFQAPPTPSSIDAEPVKKRQRTASSQDASVGRARQGLVVCRTHHESTTPAEMELCTAQTCTIDEGEMMRATPRSGGPPRTA